MPKPVDMPNNARAHSVAQVAQLIGCSRGYVYKLVNSGELKHIKLGSIKVPHDFLVEFHESHAGMDLSATLTS